MKTQQEAEREEQQRIKNLVLNYERMEDQNDSDSECNTKLLLYTYANITISTAERNGLLAPYRYEKNARNTQRTASKKLTLQDVNW